MAKYLKKFLFSALAACMAFTCLFTTACDPEEDYGDPTVDGYIVTFLYPNGDPVKGTDYAGTGQKAPKTYAYLQDASGNNLTEIDESSILDNNGTVYFNYKVAGEYKVVLENIPAGYSYEPITTYKNRARHTVTLTQKTAQYEITVLYPDGSAYANASVKLYNGEEELASLTTNSQGKATSQSVLTGNYNVVVDVPDQYGYKAITTAMSGAPVTVQLFDVNIISFKDADKISGEAFDEWANDASLNNSLMNRVNTSVDNYLYTANVKGSEETFFAITAPWSGTYSFTMRSDRDENGEIITVHDKDLDMDVAVANYSFKFYNNNYDTEISSMSVSGATNNGNNSVVISLEAGQKYIFSVSSLDGRAEYSVPFLIAYVRQPYTLETSKTGDYTLTFDQIDHAVIKFNPSESGKYSITSNTTSYDPYVVCYSAATHKPLPDADGISDLPDDLFNAQGKYLGNDNGGSGNNFRYVEDVRKSMVGNTYYFYVYIKDFDTSSSAQIDININWEEEATPDTVVNVSVATVGATLTQQPEQDGKIFHFAPVDGSATTEEREGVWYITVNETEYELHTAISLNLQSYYDSAKDAYVDGMDYSFATVESMGSDNSGPAGSDGQQTSNSYLTIYEVGSTTQAWNYTQFIATYAAKCNSVGTYKLNGELKTFLERYFAGIHGVELINWLGLNVASGCAWLLGCGYYA